VFLVIVPYSCLEKEQKAKQLHKIDEETVSEQQSELVT
jgi:hypothetical protein